MSAPPAAAALSGAEIAALEHFECPTCFEALCLVTENGGPGGLIGVNGRRSCPHYFHCGCAANLARKACPICQVPFHSIAPLPAVNTDVGGWFRFVDIDGSGSLDYDEITQGLLACLPLNWRRIETEMDGLWPRWSNKQSKVTLQDFSKPDGALSYILSHFRAPPAAAPEPPDIRTHRNEWFVYWDRVDGDGNGKLEKGEICRALIKTFHMKTAAQKGSIADTLDNIWVIFDTDGSNSVDKAEFVSENGLADTLVAELNNSELGGRGRGGANPSNAASTATTGRSDGAGGDWTCHLCTIVNGNAHTSCNMCGSARTASSSTSTSTRNWACSACTFDNSSSDSSCSVCGQAR